ncbi:MAG: S8 family serine peptidase [Bacteroidota bacterium]
MKRFLFLLIVTCLASVNFAQEGKYYYWYKGEKQALQLKDNKWFLLFSQKPDRVILSKELQIDKDRIDEIKRIKKSDAITPNEIDHYWTIVSAAMTEINLTKPFILYRTPFFYSKSGKEVGLSHLFYVKLYKSDDHQLLVELAQKNGVRIVGHNKFMPLWYTLSCNSNSKGNALEMANFFFETGYFSASQPDLMVDDLIQSVNDPYFSDQWNLHNNGQYGGTSNSDIQALDAWKITKSNSGIILAILDQGLEMNHPDLPNIYSLSYDTESETSPSVIYGNHGVAVAGIAGANTNNNTGVAGIAPASQLMSISNSLFLYPGIAEDLADGINYAWQNDAHIISNSWAHSDLQSQLLDDAIDDAVTLGRDGLGTVVTFCTQNYNSSSITYPESVK